MHRIVMEVDCLGFTLGEIDALFKDGKMQEKLVEYEIRNLYGLYNHEIKICNEENIVIVHGPNGVGKTALLKSINHLFSRNFDDLNEIPFSQINARLSSGVEVVVKRVGVSIEQLLRRKRNDAYKIEIDLKRDGKVYLSHTFADDSVSGGRIPPWFSRVGPDVWVDERTGEKIADEVFSFYIGHSRGLHKPLRKKDKEGLAAIEAALGSVKVHFVETNRLYKQQSESWKSKETKLVPSVKDCARQLVQHIGTALKDYGKKSQELDQSFPYRFISGVARVMAPDELKSRLTDLTNKSNKLKKLGILDSENIHPFDIESLDKVPPNKLEIMSLHVRDSEEKLAVFDSLSSRATLLLNSLRNKFKNKSISISKEKGLVATGPKDLDIELDALSSGEQHEIVLLYELLFKVSQDTLVLIDEPELSLHVNWQKAFLPELISIAKEVGFSSVVATHSPFIVGGKNYLMKALDSSIDE